MKMQMMAIKDRALNAFMRPWFAQSLGQAIRAFQDEVNNAGTETNKHPDDYDLWTLGEWDDNTGKLDQLAEPRQIAIGKNLLKEKA